MGRKMDKGNYYIVESEVNGLTKFSVLLEEDNSFYVECYDRSTAEDVRDLLKYGEIKQRG